ncbi:MAG TPA: altronate dehydratase family protein [Acidobacteriaceae bacterium]
MRVLHIHPNDNVSVALAPLKRNEIVDGLVAIDDIPAGHKIAIRPIAAGESVLKYGYQIGRTSVSVAAGEHVHTHNMQSALKGQLAKGGYHPATGNSSTRAAKPAVFEGYVRPNGLCAIRNEIWVINTVGCVNHAASMIAQKAEKLVVHEGSAVEGVHTFNHPYGCSQLGDDLLNTQLLLSALARHPNAAGVLVVGLGCENNQMKDFITHLGGATEDRYRYFNAQDVNDEQETGVKLIQELAEYASQFKRQTLPASRLVLGMKCGGSDGLSGITANPLVGRIADKLAAQGGTSILTEVPEMFGAEKVLLDRACDASVYDSTIDLVNHFRDYFVKHNEPIDENPSPGNKEGGITTLAEKSLGCVQKGGSSPVKEVLSYGDQVQQGLGGIALLNGPGNDGVSGTALSAAGAHMVLFTTGRGNPMGFPVPTIKIATNTPLATHKTNWIDFSAGPVADGTASMDELADKLFDQVLDVASGREHTKSENNGYREISIWKDGVTL